MASNQLTFGLSDSILGDLRRVFSAYPEIEQVLIFGSRAKGAFKDGSDIDLAVIASAMSDHALPSCGMNWMACRWCSRWTCCTGTGWAMSA